jgi:sugar phosphate isomerase/epimerase
MANQALSPLTRREFLERTALTIVAAGMFAGSLRRALAAAARPCRMTIDLVCGSIGVSANQAEAVELAARHGFQSVGADGAYLAGLSEARLADLKDRMKDRGLVFGAAGLPVEFRRDDASFKEGMNKLPRIADGLQRAGVTRVTTWLSPGHDQLTYRQNFQQHAERLREAARVLADRNLRLGLEYVGPKTSWSARRYPFIHTMAEMKELIAEIGTGNVGFLLDSWHWWHAGETAADILTLKAAEVVAVDLNDAPAGIPKDQQPDNHRELPCATGVIDVASFLNALNRIGFDGPVRAEPFNLALNQMDNDPACAAVAAALKKAFQLVT